MAQYEGYPEGGLAQEGGVFLRAMDRIPIRDAGGSRSPAGLRRTDKETARSGFSSRNDARSTTRCELASARGLRARKGIERRDPSSQAAKSEDRTCCGQDEREQLLMLNGEASCDRGTLDSVGRATT